MSSRAAEQSKIKLEFRIEERGGEKEGGEGKGGDVECVMTTAERQLRCA